jgi:hypothetical protein
MEADGSSIALPLSMNKKTNREKRSLVVTCVIYIGLSALMVLGVPVMRYFTRNINSAIISGIIRNGFQGLRDLPKHKKFEIFTEIFNV